jgi:hypothetical protein
MIAGVALVGAGAIVISPVVASPPAIHLPAVQLSAAMRPVGIENPITVFAPIIAQTLTDAQRVITNSIEDPAPILESVLLNQSNNAFDLAAGVGAGAAVLGTAAFDTPAAIVKAAKQVAAGDPAGALATLSSVTLQPLQTAASAVLQSVQDVIQNQLAIAGRLVVAVPDAAMRVATAVVNSVAQTTRAVVQAGLGVVGAAATLDPVKVVNAFTDGAANVTSVVEQTTIGGPQMVKEEAAKADLAIQPRTPSIAVAVNQGRAEIARAITQPAREKEAAAADTTVAAAALVAVPSATQPALVKAKPKGPIRKVVAAVRKEVKTVVKDIKAALRGPAKKAEAAK